MSVGLNALIDIPAKTVAVQEVLHGPKRYVRVLSYP
jgi:hypothetical protein